MALTQELIQANAATAGLTTEQINAIVTMSQNDESAVIAKKTGEIYGGLDNDIFAVSGIAKDGTEKHTITPKGLSAKSRQRPTRRATLTTKLQPLTGKRHVWKR